MKRQDVSKIFAEDQKRKIKIISFICAIVVLSVIVASLFFVYLNKTKTYYVDYVENSDLDYKVYLKDNDFFEEEYLKKDRSYIVSLIDYISADFNYTLQVADDNVDYTYSYYIESVLEVTDTISKKNLYTSTEKIVDTKSYSTTNQSVAISENIEIDYNYYNDLIKKFIGVYNLSDTNSTLTINMYVSVLGDCEDAIENKDKNSVITLTIPLTTKTISIDISSNSINNDTSFLVCQKNSLLSPIVKVSFIIALGLDIYLIVMLMRYVVKTRTAKNIYDKELKKILNNYKSYIQKINSDFPTKKYQVLEVDTFTDMLEIRDTISAPILMVESHNKDGVYFCIPATNYVLYTYRLRVSDIEDKMKNDEVLEK